MNKVWRNKTHKNLLGILHTISNIVVVYLFRSLSTSLIPFSIRKIFPCMSVLQQCLQVHVSRIVIVCVWNLGDAGLLKDVVISSIFIKPAYCIHIDGWRSLSTNRSVYFRRLILYHHNEPVLSEQKLWMSIVDTISVLL